jgi:NAD-dependent SIR2 family protein deacetylase
MTPMMQAAKLIAEADGLLIAAGAGMGVDSGLPDFRGTEGFWKAYPALKNAGIEFASIASPNAFVRTPKQAWGFYGHRLALYRNTVPHAGFQILQDIAAHMPKGALVVTSNVDGQFQKAGFGDSQVWEVHGSIHRLQCLDPCHETVWPASAITPKIDQSTCEWTGGPLPSCPKCRRLARPNVLMFNDWGWINTYTTIGRAWFEQWIEQVSKFVVLEIGAGTGLPKIRQISRAVEAPIIRLNPQCAYDNDVEVALPTGALAGLLGIRKELESIGWMPASQTSQE